MRQAVIHPATGDSPIGSEYFSGVDDIASIVRAVGDVAANLAAMKTRVRELEQYEAQLLLHADNLAETQRHLGSELAAIQAEQSNLSRSIQAEGERARRFEALSDELAARISSFEHELRLERDATKSVIAAVSKAFRP